MSYDYETIATSVAQYLADRDIYLPAGTLRAAVEAALPAPAAETVDDARFLAQMIALQSGPELVDAIETAAAAAAPSTDVECERLVREALHLKGGWREAIVELEDHCSEPVRLKNMLAAADQLDAWAARARTVLADAGRVAA